MTYTASHPGHLVSNTHWETIDAACQPCDVDYDYILRLETGESDTKFFLEDILNEALSKEEDIQRKNSQGSFSEQDMLNANFQRIYPQFANISRPVFEAVAKHYVQHAEMFGYSSEFTEKGLVSSCAYDITYDKDGYKCC